jgi:hypothetical protein
MHVLTVLGEFADLELGVKVLEEKDGTSILLS